MSTTNSNETKPTMTATTTDAKLSSRPDGKSPLPTTVDGTDAPTPGSTDPVTTGITSGTSTAE